MQHSCSTFLLSYLAPVTTNALPIYPFFVSSNFFEEKKLKKQKKPVVSCN